MTEEQIFAEAIAVHSAAERVDYVNRVCGQDEQLKANVLALLAAHEQADSLLDQPADVGATMDVAAAVRTATGVGHQIGPYKLLQEIGEGGFGVVYMAEQVEPVKRRVALKIIKPGMDSKEVVGRFEAERQALAMMDHPNIAKVFGGGTTQGGHPYFVMELVKGVPITDYCDEHCLDINERLELFVRVCHAVQHAHQKGVIHRDLKPSNVLVAEYDDELVPKIIDFGVAKALNQRLTERTMFTQFGQVIGTAQYMSPEQSKFNQLDIDTRSDIYSLGVILYELLTGSTPIDGARLRSAAFDEMMRLIREEEPPKPSTRIGSSAELPSVAKRRHAEPRRLSLLVRGDLDWITMKALEKDRSRRYATANDLATDCQRFLDHEPVSASPPSLAYRGRKFVHRNQGGVIAAALGACLLFICLGAGWAISLNRAQAETAGLKAQIEEDARKAAEEKRQTAEADLKKERVRRERQDKLHNVDVPQIERLLEAKQFQAAFDLAQDYRTEFPEDSKLRVLWQQVASQWNVETEPAGAQVFLRPYGTKLPDWGQPVGETPLTLSIAKGFYQWRISREGCATIEGCAGPESVTITRKLDPTDYVPADMVRVLGSEMSNIGSDFFIDRTEVTNRAFKDFVDAGGYTIKDYWKYPFLEQGQQISWEQAMKSFMDSSGQPGPTGWSKGIFPDGEGDYPVTGISWYEAAAFAAFKKKELPTIDHWRAAGGNSIMTYIVPASNFAGGPPAAVGSYAGVGPFGTVDTAGNVREWCFNGSGGQGHRHILGGASSDPDYMFNVGNSAPAMRRDEKTGFRCVKYIQPPSPALVADTTIPVPYHVGTKPVSDEQYEVLRRRFDYVKSPLNAAIKDGESHETWREQIVTMDAAYDGRLEIHIYAPKTAPSNPQVLVVFPGVGAFAQDTFYPDSYSFPSLERLIELGRTIVWPVYAGMYNRNTERFSSTEEAHIRPAQDIFRTLDYLEQSEEYASAQIGYIGFSMGGIRGPMHVALEKRFSLAVFVNGGLGNERDAPPPQIDPVNFAPRIKVPVLMINGRDDGIFPLETSQLPLFESLTLPAEQKKHVVIEGAAHGVDPDVLEREVAAWLDEYLDPVVVTDAEQRQVTVSRLTRRAKQALLRADNVTAEGILRELVTVLKDVSGESSPEYLRATSDLARALSNQDGKSDEAEPLCRSTYEAQLRLLGADHVDTRKTHSCLVDITFTIAWFPVRDGGPEEACRAALQHCLALKELRPDLAFCVVPSAWAYYRLNEDSQAWQALEEAAPLPASWCASWFLRAVLKSKLSEVEEAVDWYRVAEFWQGSQDTAMKAEAQKILGESAPVATTREQLAAAFDRLLQRYPKEYNLLHQRAIMYVKQGDLVAAHADLAAAFDLHRAQKLMAFDLVDWYALICQLTGDDKGLMQAHKATHELIEELRTSDIYLKRNFIRSYCTAPNMQDYADIVKFADDEFGETDNASLVVAQSIAEFRNGKAVQIAPEYSEEDVDSAVYTCYFRVLSELGKGNRKSALERLDEALAFSAKMVPTPDGPDFKWSNRAHAWVISQALLAEVRQVIELGARDFDRETVRAVADLRQNFEGRFGQQLARKLLARVGSALVEINADPTDASPTDAKSTDRPTTQIVPDGK